MLNSRMSLAQNSLPDERGSDLREPLRLPAGRQVLRACRQAGLCVILLTPSHAPHRSSMRRPRLPAVTGLPAVAGAPSAATSEPSTCDTSCKYPNFSEVLIMENL
jgi:hypothetical protein